MPLTGSKGYNHKNCLDHISDKYLYVSSPPFIFFVFPKWHQNWLRNNICLVNYYLNLRHDSISQMGVCT